MEPENGLLENDVPPQTVAFRFDLPRGYPLSIMRHNGTSHDHPLVLRSHLFDLTRLARSLRDAHHRWET